HASASDGSLALVSGAAGLVSGADVVCSADGAGAEVLTAGAGGWVAAGALEQAVRPSAVMAMVATVAIRRFM
ncbi:MAG: hypothetical protein VB093_11825, partial [Propionicimonas sp.]|nr:hypothetical protein [Propionicimonas sp.]